MKLLVISKTPIIKQIFKLITNKLNIDLTVLDVNIVSTNFDIIVIEDTLFDEQFPTATYSKQFGIISKDQHKYNTHSDFILSKPFLPSQLLAIIHEQQQLVEVDSIEDIVEDNNDIENEIEQTEEFINSLVEDISDDILDKSDESIVSSSFIDNGGILDTNELSKIQGLLSVEEENSTLENIEDENDDEWIDLANIIDQAIDEVKDYEFKSQEPIKLILNNYTMNELSGLLNKLDQNIIDSLVNGEEITLKLKVEK